MYIETHPLLSFGQVRAMVRDANNFFPRKRDLGNGPIELVIGDVLDKVRSAEHVILYWPYV